MLKREMVQKRRRKRRRGREGGRRRGEGREFLGKDRGGKNFSYFREKRGGGMSLGTC